VTDLSQRIAALEECPVDVVVGGEIQPDSISTAAEQVIPVDQISTERTSIHDASEAAGTKRVVLNEVPG
jgi:hypothetical protein